MIVAGVMSGTSADGINVAIVRLRGRRFRTRLELLAHEEYSFPAAVRRTILSFMNAKVPVADLARLNFLLGELYAEAVTRTREKHKIGAISSAATGRRSITRASPPTSSDAGRLHLADRRRRDSRRERSACPSSSDFRPADMAAGGKGAPLVPFLDYLLYRHRRVRTHRAEHRRHRQPDRDSAARARNTSSPSIPVPATW